MTLTITDFAWWHVAKAHKIDQEAFNATAWSLETFWSELSAPNRYYIALIDEDKEIVGFAGLAFNGADADIQTMVIKPEFQNLGYGKKLLDKLLEKVKEKKLNPGIACRNRAAARLSSAAKVSRVGCCSDCVR